MTADCHKEKGKLSNRPLSFFVEPQTVGMVPLVSLYGGGEEMSISSQSQGNVSVGPSQPMPSSGPPNFSSILATLYADKKKISFDFAPGRGIFLRAMVGSVVSMPLSQTPFVDSLLVDFLLEDWLEYYTSHGAHNDFYPTRFNEEEADLVVIEHRCRSRHKSGIDSQSCLTLELDINGNPHNQSPKITGKTVKTYCHNYCGNHQKIYELSTMEHYHLC
ncbi:hypothetical protein R1flu_018664 [Riccia fluitans]|uniref:Uncharacterized protein n=1 Tax=Riccia fluitans TaxID=41844 RepID=A0ABD1ZGH6_9MARC